MSVLNPTAEWLERANRMSTITILLSTTVHEVNNALQVINGGAEILAKDRASDGVVRRAEAIGLQARRASALLAELAAFARDESTATQRLDLGQIAQRALAMRQYAFAKLGLQALFEPSGGARLVCANPRRVLQAVLNLVINCEHAMIGRSSGRVLLKVAGTTDVVDLAVEDNGPGISPEVGSHLFEPGAHAWASSLGIGLAVSKYLAECQGGTLRYQPGPQGGSCFTLSFPAAAPA